MAGVGLWTTRGYGTVLRLRDVEDAVPYKELTVPSGHSHGVQ